METIETHEIEAVVDANGSVRVDDLPFAAGERVRVLVLRESPPGIRRHTDNEIQRSKAIRQSLTGAVVHYDRPDDPVRVED